MQAIEATVAPAGRAGGGRAGGGRGPTSKDFRDGSDYDLLLVARMKEELAAGINTGIIRAMGGTGKIVTNAGLVFAFTVAAMAVSKLRSIGQVGTTIAIGLLFDTLIVRSFMTPSIAALLGRWFGWPQVVCPRPVSRMLRAYGTRWQVRALLGESLDDDVAAAKLPKAVGQPSAAAISAAADGP